MRFIECDGKKGTDQPFEMEYMVLVSTVDFCFFFRIAEKLFTQCPDMYFPADIENNLNPLQLLDTLRLIF
jgi:hypothetical protein